MGAKQDITTKIIITGVRFFPGDSLQVAPPPSARAYTDSFYPNQTRIVYFELHFTPLQKPISTSIFFTLTSPDGNALAADCQIPVSLQRDTSYVWSGWGYMETGKWTPGLYTLDVNIGNSTPVRATFIIEGSTSGSKTSRKKNRIRSATAQVGGNNLNSAVSPDETQKASYVTLQTEEPPEGIRYVYTKAFSPLRLLLALIITGGLFLFLWLSSIQPLVNQFIIAPRQAEIAIQSGSFVYDGPYQTINANSFLNYYWENLQSLPMAGLSHGANTTMETTRKAARRSMYGRSSPN